MDRFDKALVSFGCGLFLFGMAVAYLLTRLH